MDFTELKIQLMQWGAVFTSQAREIMCHGRYKAITYGDYATTSGVVAVLNNQTYVNIPVKIIGTPFVVDKKGEQLILKENDIPLNINFRVISAPQYALDNVKLSDGTPVRELVMTHADRVRISPVHGCHYHCKFCTCNATFYKEITCEQLNEAFCVALDDSYNKPRHVLISGGTPREEEMSYAWLNNVYRYFPYRYPQYEFDVMLSPRGMKPGQMTLDGYKEFLKYLREECGVKSLSINLELYNDEWRRKFIPEKADIGKRNYFNFIRQAVRVFGGKNVRSSLVVGLESEEDTLNGVRELLECGCMPVLSAFVPAPGTDMANDKAPEVEVLVGIVKRADEMANTAKLQLGPICRPCTHNTLTVEHKIS